VTYDAPSLLILDEPTNHLDLETREVLVQAINEYSGAVVVVSHDWHLLELVADELWLVADGTVRPFAGDLDDYRRMLLQGSESSESCHRAATNDRQSVRRRAADKRRLIEPLRQRARQAEAAIARLTQEREALDSRLAAATGAQLTGSAVGEVMKRRAELIRLITEAESEWLATEEAIEREAEGLIRNLARSS
jgi:ATP-binding cassette subfamily F protein 3